MWVRLKGKENTNMRFILDYLPVNKPKRISSVWIDHFN